MEEANIIILTDDDGNEVEFEYIDSLEYEGAEYVFLLPVEEDDDAEGSEAVILKVDPDYDDPEMEQYVAEEDEEILTEVFGLFREKLKDDFNFED